MPLPRLLFASSHHCLDPSSGAALSTRDLLSLWARAGGSCGAVCGPRLDLERVPSLAEHLGQQTGSFQQQTLSVQGQTVTFHHGVVQSFPLSCLEAVSSSLLSQALVTLFEAVVERFQPDILLTYGGDPATRAILHAAHQRRLPVVFALHNFAYYPDPHFQSVQAAFVPSTFAQGVYRQRGLATEVLPGPWDWSRIVAPAAERRYVTFVNPRPEKGLFVFARLAVELGRRRPDIPLLVVEGRGQVDHLASVGVDWSGLNNLHRLRNSPDPRQIYAVSRVLLMPSLWWESFGRVAAEACINGIPVLASRRGALPEVLESTGLLLDVPASYTEHTRQVPSAEEIQPWIDLLERLWDDEGFYQQQQHCAQLHAEQWRPENLLPRFVEFFQRAQRRETVPPL